MKNLKVTIRHGEGDNSAIKTVTIPFVNTNTTEGTNQVVDTIKNKYGQDVNIQRIETEKGNEKI